MKCLEHLRGKTVEVELVHKIYGKQTTYIKDFQPREEKDTIGFSYNSTYIYLFYNEIETAIIENDHCVFEGKTQTIKIKAC